jgi:hypothetical protein
LEIDELKRSKLKLENEKLNDEVILEELVKQLEMEKSDKVKMEQTIRQLSDSLIEYEKEIIYKTDQISSLSLALLKQNHEDGNGRPSKGEDPRI